MIFTCASAKASSLDIEKRTEPVGTVILLKEPITTSASPVSANAQTMPEGKKIYDSKCLVCHGSGLAGAPKFGNKSDWAARQAQGMAVLSEHAIKGYKAMPPKGTCTDCTTEEIQAAIKYMLPKS